MLALQSYEQASGFSVLTADELYYVNGGSCNFSNLSFSIPSYSNSVQNAFSNFSEGLTIKSGNFDLNIKADLSPSLTITATWHF